MARDVTVKCDKCGEVIARGRMVLTVKIGRMPRLTHGKQIDLCEEHGREFEAWLAKLPELVDEAEEPNIDEADDVF